jgi:hypothetical protein
VRACNSFFYEIRTGPGLRSANERSENPFESGARKSLLLGDRQIRLLAFEKQLFFERAKGALALLPLFHTVGGEIHKVLAFDLINVRPLGPTNQFLVFVSATWGDVSPLHPMPKAAQKPSTLKPPS